MFLKIYRNCQFIFDICFYLPETIPLHLPFFTGSKKLFFFTIPA